MMLPLILVTGGHVSLNSDYVILNRDVTSSTIMEQMRLAKIYVYLLMKPVILWNWQTSCRSQSRIRLRRPRWSKRGPGLSTAIPYYDV